MRETRSIAFLIRNPGDFVEGIRSALGLALENYLVEIFVFCAVGDPETTTRENLAWLNDMEVEVFTDHWEDAQSLGFLFRTPEELGARLKDADLVIPFGRTP